MTTNRTSHDDCLHEATKAARATCRRQRASAVDAKAKAIADLLAQFPDSDYSRDLLLYGAHRLGWIGTDRTEAAEAVLNYFAPSPIEAENENRRRNGYLITTDPRVIRSTFLRMAS